MKYILHLIRALQRGKSLLLEFNVAMNFDFLPDYAGYEKSELREHENWREMEKAWNNATIAEDN